MLSPAQKAFLLTSAQAVAKSAATVAAAHGFISGANVEMWTGALVFGMSTGYSFYNDQLRVMALASLDILRQRILAEDARVKAGAVSPTSAVNRLAEHAADVQVAK